MHEITELEFNASFDNHAHYYAYFRSEGLRACRNARAHRGVYGDRPIAMEDLRTAQAFLWSLRWVHRGGCEPGNA
ncbi:MAG: hypothetical protein AB7Q00_14625 [Phycisphaerales bacterium]